MDRLGKWIAPPELGDRELNRQARLLNGVLLILILATFTLLGTLIVLGMGSLLGLTLLGGAFALEAYGLVLMRKKQVLRIARATVYGLWLILQISIYFFVGIQGPGLLGQMLLIIVAGLLVSEQLGVALGLATIIGNYGAMLYQASVGIPRPAAEASLLSLWVVQSIYFLLAIALTQVSSRSIRAAMTEARWNEEVLTDRVAELRQAQTQLEMSELALRRREAILEAVGIAAERLFRDESFQQSIGVVLEELGLATGADRVYLFENHIEKGTLYSSQRAEWVANNITPQIDNSSLQNIPLIDAGFARWQELLGNNLVLKGNIKDFPDRERDFLEEQGIISLLVIPIFIQDTWWGLMGFDETKWEREWSPAEEEALRAAAGILGGAIERRAAEAKLNRSEARYLAILEDQVDIICRFTPDGRLTFGNNAFCNFFGMKSHEVEGTNFWELIPPADLERVKQKIAGLEPEAPVLVSDPVSQIYQGNLLWQQWTDRGLFDKGGKLVEVQAMGRDVTEEVRLRERLSKSLDEMATQAMTDSLTGLLNRRAIMDHAEAEWQRASREGRPLSLILVDLDQLKEINDLYGHLAGDKVLMMTANLMQTGMRRYDWVGRWGGDEFLLILPGTEIQEARSVAERLHDLVRQTRVKLDEDVGIELMVSIGVASQAKIDSGKDALEDLLAKADEAMYRAKESGRDRVAVSE